jgi:glycosyltransferase involved in cell wall biosynthesis
MRICLLGEFSGNLDEAARKISFHIAKELLNKHDLLTLDLREVFHRNFWSSLERFSPQIVHYIHGGSSKSLLLLSMISRLCPRARTVASIMRLSPSFVRFLSIYKPDIILAQSFEVMEKLKNIGCSVEFMPCGGVDTERFTPAHPEVKKQLREKYEISRDKFIVLHVGSIKAGRNILLLEKFQNAENQVVIVGPTSVGFDKKILQKLRSAGCLVFVKYFQNIEEIYALSDCYVFPVLFKPNVTCIDFPLSILEAMSCNLPIITTKYGALPKIFSEVEGLFFADTEWEFSNALEEVKNGIQVKTREKIKPYSWKNIAKKLENIYLNLVCNGNGR